VVSDDLKIVILAGGAGTRLWPMSTKEKPKQFQRLISERTMLQETYDRIAFVKPENIYVSTNEEYVHYVKDQLPEIPESNIIAEPALRDTAPCIGLAALTIEKDHPDAIMAVVYADHLVRDEKEFQEKLELAAKLAQEENTLNIIEVKAKAPNINLGYVQIGKELAPHIHEFKEFKEKPDLPTAEQFISSGNYLWNTGFYVWKTSRILEEFKKHLPQVLENLESNYESCEKISIDYGIMEKVDPSEVRIISADLGWSDIGTWATLYEELAENPSQNITKGSVMQVDSEGNLIYNEGDQEISTLGLKNTIVINYKDHLLICPKERSADLKTLLNERRQNNS
jgi:mannose-1-phosphate guanylyltransferase